MYMLEVAELAASDRQPQSMHVGVRRVWSRVERTWKDRQELT